MALLRYKKLNDGLKLILNRVKNTTARTALSINARFLLVAK